MDYSAAENTKIKVKKVDNGNYFFVIFTISLCERKACFQNKTKTISDLLLSLAKTLLANKTYVENILVDMENEVSFAAPAIELM